MSGERARLRRERLAGLVQEFHGLTVLLADENVAGAEDPTLLVDALWRVHDEAGRVLDRFATVDPSGSVERDARWIEQAEAVGVSLDDLAAARHGRTVAHVVELAGELVELRSEVESMRSTVADLAMTVTVLRGELAELSERDADAIRFEQAGVKVAEWRDHDGNPVPVADLSDEDGEWLDGGPYESESDASD